ncbi:epoxide hydrolase family protein [Flindersiella endophytica]
MTLDLSRRTVVASVPALLAGAVLPGHLPRPDSVKAVRPQATGSPTRFSIDMPKATLREIEERVRTAKFPITSKGARWRYGVDEAWFKSLVAYWRRGYDWKRVEAKLNKTPQYLVSIGGRDLHYAHLAPRGGTVRNPPILLLHGWPYSYATMLPLAERLAGNGYEVVVPSQPGSVFSESIDDQVRGLRSISRHIGLLMTEVLGHERYLIHAGDQGAVIADWLSIDTPHNIVGLHTNLVAVRQAGAPFGSGQTGVPDPTPEELAYAQTEVELLDREFAYFRLQLTRPETIAYALTDSPVGLAAYVLDKWQKWTDTRQRPFEAIYSRDRLLTEVMLYALTDTIATSIWPYTGFGLEGLELEPGQKIGVPFGYSSFPDPITPRMPKHYAQRSRSDIRLWREHDNGGHFAVLEQTDALAADIITFTGLTT